MTESQKLAVINTISMVAWADGEVQPEEQVEIRGLIGNIGDIEENTIAAALASPPDNDDTLAQISDFYPELAMQLLNFCYRLAISDNKIHKGELAAIRRIAGTFWPDQVDEVLSYLKRNYEAEQGYFRLVLLPQIVKGHPAKS